MNDIYPIAGFTEPVSCGTHLIASVVFLFLSVFLLRRGGMGVGRFCTLLVFALSCVFLLSMSGVYHLLPKGGLAREVLQRLDHAAIFVMIAGTFTATHGVLFTGMWRWGMILTVWLLAATGIVIKTVFFDSIPEFVGLIGFLAFGWLGVLSAVAVYRNYGFTFIKPLLYGGIVYTIGALIEYIRYPVLIQGVVGPHELFHVAVIFGISFHWWFIHRAVGCQQGPD